MSTSAPVNGPTYKPQKTFPAWHLPTGITKAADGELETSIESCDRWEWFGGSLVVAGVVAAVVIAAIHPRYDSFWEQWGSVIADSLVAIGVVTEIRFGQMAGLRQSELKRRSDEHVAAANERAAKAEREAGRLRAEFGWRKLMENAMSILQAELGKTFGAVNIVHMENDPESQNLAWLIAKAFVGAPNWRVTTVACSYLGPVQFGVRISVEGQTASKVIQSAFAAAGIDFVIGDPPNWNSAHTDTRPSASGIVAVGPNAAQVYIGPKPMPYAEETAAT